MAPDEWEGMKTKLLLHLHEHSHLRRGFPNGGGESRSDAPDQPGDLGPTHSKPTYDPNNGNFVYQRFQRGIMHFDRTTGLNPGHPPGRHISSRSTYWPEPPCRPGPASPPAASCTRHYTTALRRPSPPVGRARHQHVRSLEKDGVAVAHPQPAVPGAALDTCAATTGPRPNRPDRGPSAPAKYRDRRRAKFIEHVNAPSPAGQ